MQVAKINADNEIEEVGELKALFPNVSFQQTDQTQIGIQKIM